MLETEGEIDIYKLAMMMERICPSNIRCVKSKDQRVLRKCGVIFINCLMRIT